MSSTAPLNKAEVEKMVNDWYVGLDVHAPEFEMLQYVSDDGLEMVFPEATLRSLAEFELWLQGVYRIFFDEVHTMQSLDTQIAPDGSQADVKLVVRWEASRWKAPSPKSERLRFDAYQTWIVKRSPTTGKPVIAKYVVDDLKALPGSVPL